MGGCHDTVRDVGWYCSMLIQTYNVLFSQAHCRAYRRPLKECAPIGSIVMIDER